MFTIMLVQMPDGYSMKQPHDYVYQLTSDDSWNQFYLCDQTLTNSKSKPIFKIMKGFLIFNNKYKTLKKYQVHRD